VALRVTHWREICFARLPFRLPCEQRRQGQAGSTCARKFWNFASFGV